MKKIFLTILTLIIIAVCSLAYIQRDNISAIINGSKYSSEELEEQISENKKNLKEELQKYTTKTINDISAEDEEKLIKGEITLEEISKKYNYNTSNTNTENDSESNSNNNQNTSNDTTNSMDNVINDSVSQLYAIKASFVSELGEVVRQAYTEYKSLPKEKQNSSGKQEVVLNNINKISQLEKSCDAEVELILSHLQSELEKLKVDTEIVQVLRASYEDEKEAKKSYYLSLYYN